VSFYSNGRLTVLAPSGWACTALVAGDGGQKLDVYPPGKPDYASELAPKGAELVEIQGEYTGHIPGAQLVCRYPPTRPLPLKCNRTVFQDHSARRPPAKR
jgi:hypothetical protein